MKGIQKRLGSLLMAAVMLLSLAVTPAMAAGEKEPPTKVKICEVTGFMPETLNLDLNDETWLNAIKKVVVNDVQYEKATISFGSAGNIWDIGSVTGSYGSYQALKIVAKFSYPATIVISADGYKDLKVQVSKNASVYPYVYTAVAEVVENSGSGSEPEPPTSPEKSTINVYEVKFESNSAGDDWYVTFGTESDNYINAINGVSVNGNTWKSKTGMPYTGGYYCKYNRNSMNNTKTLVLGFAQKKYLSSGTDVLKSGDIITITADGYNDLTFKLVIDKDGDATVSEDTTLGDIYQLHVKIEGSFEAAIVGQKNYDGVSSASVGGASSNKNSSVTVYGALVEQGNELTDKDWEKLDYGSEIKLKGSSVSIVPDTKKGTPENADSGMEGVYMKTSSDLTLDGTPKDPGSYLISISITDNQGRTATSNTLPFRIYTGEETLADQIQTKNLKQYSNGLYAWDIMEPWAIKNFGSNVDGEENSVRVPEDLEVWFGSHTSGTYGVLGYDIAWKQVEAGDIPQTLYIPNGCNLTLMNMKVLSSVRIVVEKGGAGHH